MVLSKSVIYRAKAQLLVGVCATSHIVYEICVYCLFFFATECPSRMMVVPSAPLLDPAH